MPCQSSQQDQTPPSLNLFNYSSRKVFVELLTDIFKGRGYLIKKVLVPSQATGFSKPSVPLLEL